VCEGFPLVFLTKKIYIDGIITFAGPTDGGVAFTISRGALMVSYYGTPQDLYSD